MPPLWMQIVDLSIDLPAASLLPSILPSISFLFWHYHPPSCGYQFISPHISPLFSYLITPLQPYSPVKMCVILCTCKVVYQWKERYLSGQWSEQKTNLNYSLETGKWQTAKVNVCVFQCPSSWMFPASHDVSLFKYLFLSLYLSLRPILSLRTSWAVNIKASILARVMVGGVNPWWLDHQSRGSRSAATLVITTEMLLWQAYVSERDREIFRECCFWQDSKGGWKPFILPQHWLVVTRSESMRDQHRKVSERCTNKTHCQHDV